MVLLIFYRPGKRVAGSFFILQANKQGEEVIWMGPSERRRAILEHLCQKRFDTTKNLAELFGVCERTIRNDLVVLTCSYPIEDVYKRQAPTHGSSNDITILARKTLLRFSFSGRVNLMLLI